LPETVEEHLDVYKDAGVVEEYRDVDKISGVDPEAGKVVAITQRGRRLLERGRDQSYEELREGLLEADGKNDVVRF
jgi:DNA-binding transcriptional ArsR family regulator